MPVEMHPVLLGPIEQLRQSANFFGSLVSTFPPSKQQAENLPPGETPSSLVERASLLGLP
jgi:hypothetical protein